MLGAIFGDMVGAPYEFNNIHTKEFPLVSRRTGFTDDTVMTVAVAAALLESKGKGEKETKESLIRWMKHYGQMYPDAGYGGRFFHWVLSDETRPYNSYGNGSAMRVSSAGWLYDTLEETEEKAGWTAEVTHNHPEGIKGAKATAAAIFLARTGTAKVDILKYITDTYGYDLSENTDSIRKWYYFNETCQKTVPQAIRVFYESKDYEDTLRLGVSLGGDSDTLACIAGGIAEAYYGMPEELKKKALELLTPELREPVFRFQETTKMKNGEDR